jgi:hypothetical protein
MSKNRQYWENRKPREQKKIHPIWGAIGIFLAILTPILSYTSALLLIQENFQKRWVIIPMEIYAKGADPLIYLKIIITFLFILLFSFVIMMITFISYRIFGPSRYGPYDLLQSGYHGPRYKR